MALTRRRCGGGARFSGRALLNQRRSPKLERIISMSVDAVVCPDCGGVIGGDDGGGRRACTCVLAGASKHDTVRIEVPLPADVNEKRKVCLVCGKDVAGHRRVKDSRGYMCYQCARDEMD